MMSPDKDEDEEHQKGEENGRDGPVPGGDEIKTEKKEVEQELEQGEKEEKEEEKRQRGKRRSGGGYHGCV